MRLVIVALLLGAILFVGSFGLRLWYPLPYRDIIIRASAEHGIDPHLLAAIIREESRFRPRAVSPRGASGLMQLMPSTAEWVAEQAGHEEFELSGLFDPDVNIFLGSWYFSYLLDHFDGDVPLAVAAYNGGLYRVKNWIESGVWTGTVADMHNIPTTETRNFLARVLRSYRVYRWLYRVSARETE